jgi:hypothetical protein
MPAAGQSKNKASMKRVRRPVAARPTKGRRPGEFGEALGASRTFSVASKPHGPFGVMALADELKDRLVSRGGRPADSAATIRRLVPLRQHVWRELKAQADLLSGHGRHVSPGQLAAMLLERSLSDLEESTNASDRSARS